MSPQVGKTLPTHIPGGMFASFFPESVMSLPRLSRLWICLCILLAGFAIAQACQVPVFRYALERWEPAGYRVSIAPGPDGLSDAEQKAVEILRGAPGDPTSPANVEIELEQPASGAPAAGQLILRYPHRRGAAREEPIWQAPLTAENVRRLVESPARVELRRRLLAGESAIWILLESGDPAKDAAAEKAMTIAMGEAQSSLKLPEPEAASNPAAARPGPHANENAEVLRTDLPVEIRFSLLRLKRNDPAEAALVAMLTHLEDDLGDYVQEPMVFPVFGRGRVLEPLIGAGVTSHNMMGQAGYLCGACSCEVKEQNPGMDLLMAANWEPVDTTPQLEIVRSSPELKPAPAPKPFPVVFVACSTALPPNTSKSGAAQVSCRSATARRRRCVACSPATGLSTIRPIASIRRATPRAARTACKPSPPSAPSRTAGSTRPTWVLASSPSGATSPGTTPSRRRWPR